MCLYISDIINQWQIINHYVLSTYNKYDTRAMKIDCTSHPPRKKASHNLEHFVICSE